MTELKVYHCNEWHNEYTEFYLKFEADKAIADLEESHKMEVGQLLVVNREQAVNANRLRDSMEQAIRRQKYKRCLNNAWWILREEFFAEDCHDERWVNWAIRWYKRWMELAKQFKEASND